MIRLKLNKSKLISLVLVALLIWHFGGVNLYAQTRVIEKQHEAQREQAIVQLGGSERFDSLLGELKDIVKQGSAKTKAAPEKGFAGIEKLKAISERLVAENDKNQDYFNALENLIKDKSLGDEILSRHRQFVSEYEAKYKTLLANLDGIESAHKDATGLLGRLTGKNQKVDWDGPINRTLSFIDANTPAPPKHHFDPNNLPHRSLKADHPIPPKLTRAEWDKALSADFADSADSTKTSTAKTTAQESSSTQSNATEGGHSGPPLQSQTAQPIKPLGTAPPTPADLAETIEVKFTPEIRALAESLDKNPVKIYNWVHNNIEFTPTWGSIQGAELCMENRAGNAFDTASLLIALLRYSGVPARYEMGTIEVPIDKFKNWAGGFTNDGAAASLFASGGVASVVRRVDQSGKVVSVRLEHIWVKAFVDYSPSSGAINVQGDAWVDLDASFKQFTYAARRDFSSTVAADPQALANQILAGANINTTTGFTTRINTSPFQSVIDSATNQIQQSLNGLTPDQLVTNLIGSKIIQKQELAVLPSGLSYKRLATANAFASIPMSLRHTITLRLEDRSSNNLLSLTLSLPEIGKKRLALNYVAASEADASALVGVNSQTAINLIPSSIMLKPELRLNEQALATGSSIGFGNQQVFKYTFSAPTISTPEVANQITAGEQIAIGLDLGQISPAQLDDDATYFSNIQNLINNNQTSALLQKKIAERMLNSIIWTWFSRTDLASRVTASAADAFTLRYPSAGFCFLDLEPSTLFGAVRGATLTSLSLDIDRDVVITMSKNGNTDSLKRLGEIQGSIGSSLEAALPEQFFSKVSGTPRWGSTTTLLNLANTGSAPVVEINQNNSAALLPNLALPQELNDEIADAVNTGLVVITPQVELTVLRFRGTGYIVEDPRTGSSAYLISGGRLSGGVLIGSASEISDTGICGPAAPNKGFSTPSQASCDDPTALEKLKDLLLSVATSAAGSTLSLINSVIGLITDFIGILNCLHAQGIVAAQEFIANLVGLAGIAALASVAFASPIAAAILAGITNPVTAPAVALIVLDVVYSYLIAKAAVYAARKITGC
jgi:transglutaminase-like putative cysteine protease